MRQEPIAFSSAAVELRGTISVPDGDGPMPAVVEDGEEDAPISPDYKRVVLDWQARETATETPRDGRSLG